MKASILKTRLLAWALPALLGVLLIPATAHADVTGNIEGVVTDQATGKKLAGVTVTVTSPALQGEQTEFTDAGGHYIITELPPGEYLVRFYFSDINVERPGIFLQSDKTLPVNITFPTQKAEVKTYRIVEKAPTVDVGNTQQQTTVTSELIRNTPVQGRTYDAIMAMAPGAAQGTGEAGIGKGASISFSGATGPENNYLIDGVNSTNPAFGLVGTQLTLEFVGETELITGGYNAEYGRATGGVVNVITKSGSNQFHGGLWLYATPFQLEPKIVGRSGEAIYSRTKEKYGLDFGFDLGGPIVKDKVWFYVGFAPTFTSYDTVRSLRERTDADMPAGSTTPYGGDLAPITCPEYLDKRLCTSPGYNMQNLGSAYDTHYSYDKRLYNWIAKFNFQLNANNSLSIQYIGSPATTDGLLGTLNGSAAAALAHVFDNTHDAQIHFVSKLLDRRLQVDVLVGYHYEDARTTTPPAGQNSAVIYQVTEPLAYFEPSVTPCAINPATPNFNPCPVLNYQDNGYGYINHTTNQRVSAAASATYFARLGGTHALKIGADFEDNIYKDQRGYSGGPLYTITPDDPDPEIYREYAHKINANGDNGPGMLLPGGLAPTTSTLNYGAYLRDSYNVGFVPGLTVNAGVRWEGQQAQDSTGKTFIGIYDNWAPRVGVVYDWTRKGRSKIFASYGRFYESIPLDINDREFGQEGLIANYSLGNTCAGFVQGARLNPASCPQPMVTNNRISGGTNGIVAPDLKGQFSEEVVAGVQYDVGLDMVLGATYIHRDLGRIIEDVSPDGGNTYLVANPGSGVDEGEVKKLENKISATAPDPSTCSSIGGPGCPRANLQQQLAEYKNVGSGFPKPVRNYDAMVLTAQKRLSHNFLLLASYTYSRTVGNYPGLFQASNGQLDPNISTQYDLRELLINRNGPLPNDHPHNIKVQGSYFIPFGDNTVVLGLAFNGLSGSPIEVLGSHAFYGPDETYVLPRGSGGRTPFTTQFDLHAQYRRQISKIFTFEAYADVFNLFNEQAVATVDEQYTTSAVRPIIGGTIADLVNLKTVSGNAVTLNPNYGRATSYQAPLSMRFGVRLSF